MTKQEFIISQLKPYFLDRSICGYEGDGCVYLASDGRMCVFGKNLNEEVRKKYAYSYEGSSFFLTNFGEEVLIEESRNKLSHQEWDFLQRIHDEFANKRDALSLIEKLEIQASVDLTELKQLI